MEERLCRWCNGHFEADNFAKAWCHCHGISVHCSRDCAAIVCPEKSLYSHCLYYGKCHTAMRKLCHACGTSIDLHKYDHTGVCPTCQEPLKCFPFCLNQPAMVKSTFSVYPKAWFYYDKNLDMKHPILYNDVDTYCTQCFPVVDKDTEPIKAFLRGRQSEDSYLSLLPPEVRGLVAPLILPNSEPCCVCLRRNVPMYALRPRYGFDHLCMDCNNLIEEWYGGGFTEKKLARRIHNRGCIPKILKVVNKRIAQSNSRVKRKKTRLGSKKRNLVREDLVNAYYTERVNGIDLS